MINVQNSQIFNFFNTLLKFRNNMNVQLSRNGSKLLNDKKLASKVIQKVITDHKKLEDGENIIIMDEDSNKTVTISMLSSHFDEKID